MPRPIRITTLVTALVCMATFAHADVTISSAATANMSCSAGVCVPTATNAVLNVGDLETLLASGNVEVTTSGNGVQADNIDVDAALAWSSANTLALDAYDSIAVSKPTSVTGAGGLSLTTNDGGGSGTLSFGSKGHLTFQNLASQLAINGTAYALENSVKSLASAVVANPNGSYALANSYYASKDGTYPNCPIDTTLNGTIEGLGNTITGLTIRTMPKRDDKRHFAAFLGVVGTSGVVENLRLKGINYIDTDHYAPSGLVIENAGYLYGDEVTGSIVSRPKSAGDSWPFTNPASEMGKRQGSPKYHADPGAAGLVVNNLDTGTITSSSTSVRIEGADGLTGGLVATNLGTISLSSANGLVSGGAAGGLVGANFGTIDESYATDSVSGLYTGGFASGNGEDPGVGTISNSYSTGSGGAGGFIDSQAGGEIESSYSTGIVPTGGGGFVCGVSNAEPLSTDYWDTTTSGTIYATCGDGNWSGITGLTTQQLQSGLPAGFDPSIWAENPKINNGLPYLINNPPEK